MECGTTLVNFDGRNFQIDLDQKFIKVFFEEIDEILS